MKNLILASFLFLAAAPAMAAEQAVDASVKNECLVKAVDAIVDYLQKDNPGSDIWKSVSKDQFVGLFDANETIGKFTLTDIVEDEFTQTVIFSADDSDYIVFASYGRDENSGECVIDNVDGGQNDND